MNTAEDIHLLIGQKNMLLNERVENPGKPCGRPNNHCFVPNLHILKVGFHFFRLFRECPSMFLRYQGTPSYQPKYYPLQQTSTEIISSATFFGGAGAKWVATGKMHWSRCKVSCVWGFASGGSKWVAPGGRKVSCVWGFYIKIAATARNRNSGIPWRVFNLCSVFAK